MFRRGRTALGLALAFGLLAQAAKAGETGIAGLDRPVLDGVRVEQGVPEQVGSGPDPQTYTFLGGRDWPAIRVFAEKPLDWSRADALTMEVENPGSAPFRLLLRIDDDPHADGGDAHSLTGTTELAPGRQVRLVMPLDTRPLGMLARPSSPAASQTGEQVVREIRGSIDPGHVTALHISGYRADADLPLRIGLLSLRARRGDPSRNAPIVDGFGQSVLGDWPEKVASDAQLRDRLRRAAVQTRELAKTAPILADTFGGIDPSTRLRATGFFRTEKRDGRWSLVTPKGHRFFSLGVDGVGSSNPTRLTGREWMFGKLPASLDAEPGMVDFGAADIEHGLGPDWRARWRTAVLQRLRAWGFNTLGNWSEAGLTDGASMPYVVFYDFEGESAAIEMPGGRSLADPFDPRFAAVADAVAQTMASARRDDPFLLGYFSGNELPWGSAERPEEGIAARVLAQGPDSPAKRAMVEGLRARYGTSRSFSAAWGLAPLANWSDALAAPIAWPEVLTAAARHDVEEFQGRFAELYFCTVAQAIKRQDPNHLYLGTRFANFTPEIVAACARWCDVLSFNVYGRSPEEEAEAWRRFDRPVLIGEFHFGSGDRGPFWSGMVDVGTESARGPAYAAYVSAAVADPAIVGCHWFRYADEPATGVPYDGENGHIGLVGITDIPFSGFVAAVAAANRSALSAFAAQGRVGLRGTQ